MAVEKGQGLWTVGSEDLLQPGGKGKRGTGGDVHSELGRDEQVGRVGVISSSSPHCTNGKSP